MEDRFSAWNGLFTAVKENNLRVLHYLLVNGANVHLENDHALWVASKHGKIDAVKELLEFGADVNTGNGRAVRDAGSLEVIKMLIAAGANHKTEKLAEERIKALAK